MPKGKPHVEEPQAGIEELAATFSLDDFVLTYGSEAVYNDALPLIEEFLANSSDGGGKTVSVKLTEHRRNYGSVTRYTLEFVVQIPRPDAAVVVRKGHGDARRVVQQDIDFEAPGASEG